MERCPGEKVPLHSVVLFVFAVVLTMLRTRFSRIFAGETTKPEMWTLPWTQLWTGPDLP